MYGLNKDISNETDTRLRTELTVLESELKRVEKLLAIVAPATLDIQKNVQNDRVSEKKPLAVVPTFKTPLPVVSRQTTNTDANATKTSITQQAEAQQAEAQQAEAQRPMPKKRVFHVPSKADMQKHYSFESEDVIDSVNDKVDPKKISEINSAYGY